MRAVRTGGGAPTPTQPAGNSPLGWSSVIPHPEPAFLQHPVRLVLVHHQCAPQRLHAPAHLRQFRQYPRPAASRQLGGHGSESEFNGIPGRREQPIQKNRTYNRMHYSNRPDLLENLRRRMTARDILKPAKKASSTNALQNSNRHNVSINYFNINFDCEVSKIKDRTTAQNSRNPLIKIP
jgi:hypothetical protein